MTLRYTHFVVDVSIDGDPDLIAQADSEHLLDHARETLVEMVGETPARWFEPDGVTDGTATFRLRVGTTHDGEPTDTEALHAALRVVREHAPSTRLDAETLQYDRVTPTGPLGADEPAASNSPETGDTDIDTESDTGWDDAAADPRDG